MRGFPEHCLNMTSKEHREILLRFFVGRCHLHFGREKVGLKDKIGQTKEYGLPIWKGCLRITVCDDIPT